MITTPQFPINATFGNGAWFFNPDIQVPWTDSWNISFQRSMTKDTVVELRYQGNRNYKAWTIENWNATNVYETNWLTGRNGVGLPDGEFEKAQANLRANVLAGRGSSMAYMGPGTGTVPLPILLAHLNGQCPYNSGATCAAASDPTKYTGNVWSSSTFTGALNPFSPSPTGFASNLYLSSFTSVSGGVQTRLWNNALALGLPDELLAAQSAVERGGSGDQQRQPPDEPPGNRPAASSSGGGPRGAGELHVAAEYLRHAPGLPLTAARPRIERRAARHPEPLDV
jgi:hypothetical protein